jgi:hypothetical protein
MPGENMSYSLFYSIQTGEVQSNQLTITADGVVTASIGNSKPGTPVRAIGRYYLPVGTSDPEITAIEKVIRDYDLVRIAPFKCAGRYGGRYSLFVIEADGLKTQHIADTADPLPQPLSILEEKLQPLFARVGVEGAQRAVSMRLGFSPDTVTPGDPVRITLEVQNGGKFDAEIRNFAGFRQGGADVLKINFWRPPVPPSGDPDYSWSLDLTGKEWLVAERKTLKSKGFARLSSHGSLKAWTNVRMPKANPEKLIAELVYYSHEESEEEDSSDLVVGEYHADAVILTVLPRK